eukprot:989730-Pyramimonas_sp.AAC.1
MLRSPYLGLSGHGWAMPWHACEEEDWMEHALEVHFWDPAGNAPCGDFVREVDAWLNVASGSTAPPQQAAALQRGLGRSAMTSATRVPSTIKNYAV